MLPHAEAGYEGERALKSERPAEPAFQKISSPEFDATTAQRSRQYSENEGAYEGERSTNHEGIDRSRQSHK